MKQLTIPAPVLLMDTSVDPPTRMLDRAPSGAIVESPPVTFAAYVIRYRINSDVFRDPEALSRVDGLIRSLHAASAGGPWNLEDSDQALLARACAVPIPPQALSTLALSQLRHFDEAILKAAKIDAVVLPKKAEVTPMRKAAGK